MASHYVTLLNNGGYPSWNTNPLNVEKGDRVYFTLNGIRPYVWGFDPNVWTETAAMWESTYRDVKADATITSDALSGRVDQFATYTSTLNVNIDLGVPDPLPRVDSNIFHGSTNIDDYFELVADNGGVIANKDTLRAGYFFNGSEDINDRYYADHYGYCEPNNTTPVTHLKQNTYDLNILFAAKGQVHLDLPYFAGTKEVNFQGDGTANVGSGYGRVDKAIDTTINWGNPPPANQSGSVSYFIHTYYITELGSVHSGTGTWLSTPTINSSTGRVTFTARATAIELYSGYYTAKFTVEVYCKTGTKKSNDAPIHGDIVKVNCQLTISA